MQSTNTSNLSPVPVQMTDTYFAKNYVQVDKFAVDTPALQRAMRAPDASVSQGNQPSDWQKAALAAGMSGTSFTLAGVVAGPGQAGLRVNGLLAGYPASLLAGWQARGWVSA